MGKMAGRANARPHERAAARAPTMHDLSSALCLCCNYPLKGLGQPRCPECGHAFEPQDVRTYNTGKPLGRVARWWLKPTGVWIIAAAGVAGVLLIAARTWMRHWSISYGYCGYTTVHVPQWTGVYFDWLESDEVAAWIWVAILVAWAVLAGGRWIVVRARAQPAWRLTADLGRRRATAWIFLVSAFLAGFRVHQCPHASYYEWWGWGGIAHSTRGGPCSYRGLTDARLFGNWYVYRT
jgi:hypothetical protein